MEPVDGWWEFHACMGILTHCMYDRANPRSHLALPRSAQYCYCILPSYSNSLQRKNAAAVGKILRCIFTSRGKKALLIAVVFHTGTTSIPLSPALKHLQNRQGE